MYQVENQEEALDQLAALPAEGLPAYAELLALLEVAPWSGTPYNRSNPDAGMRTHGFGGDHGLAVYLVLEEQRRVIVLRVIWID